MRLKKEKSEEESSFLDKVEYKFRDEKMTFSDCCIIGSLILILIGTFYFLYFSGNKSDGIEPQYNQPQYNQPQYNQPQYNQPQYSPRYSPRFKRSPFRKNSFKA